MGKSIYLIGYINYWKIITFILMNYFIFLNFWVAWAQYINFLGGNSNKLVPVLNYALACSNYSGQNPIPKREGSAGRN